jgi:DNA-binding NtrC family response regulator
LNKPVIRITNEVFDTLKKYDFPGNVRELRNMTERAIMLCKGNSLGVEDFRFKSHKTEKVVLNDEIVDLKINEIKMIRKALQMCKYNQTSTADMLGITRDALIRKMKKYDINVSRVEE